MSQSKCLLSVSTPDYLRMYDREIQSQRAYAQKYDLRFSPVNPGHVRPGEAKWQKLKQLHTHLLEYDVVLLLDTDCLVREHAPDICAELVEGKWVYMARGVSNRFNSGVMLLVRHQQSIDFVQAILMSRGQRLQPKNIVSAEGENGHVIEMAEHPRFAGIVHELSYRWNNNQYLTQPEYIRHYSGPMKKWHGRDGL